jgi:hypothetical protein
MTIMVRNAPLTKTCINCIFIIFIIKAYKLYNSTNEKSDSFLSPPSQQQSIPVILISLEILRSCRLLDDNPQYLFFLFFFSGKTSFLSATNNKTTKQNISIATTNLSTRWLFQSDEVRATPTSYSNHLGLF